MSYQDLLQAAKRDPGSVNFTDLRLAYARSPGYDPYCVGAVPAAYHGRIRLALRIGDTAGLIVALSALLERQFFDISAHHLAATAYERIGDQVTAANHRKIARGLVGSILQSGNGRSFETAFQVITIAEEYAVLEMLHIKPGSKSLCHHQGHHFDVFQVSPASPDERDSLPGPIDQGQPGELYFNIDLFYGSFAHQRLVAALAGRQPRRAIRWPLGLWLLYCMPILLCLAGALLLEASSARDLPVLGTVGTILFLSSIVAAMVSFFLVLLHAGRRRP